MNNFFMYFNIMDYIKIFSLIIIVIRIIWIFMKSHEIFSVYKKWFKYQSKMDDKEESKCYNDYKETCQTDGSHIRKRLEYQIITLFLEISSFYNPNFYLLITIYDMKLLASQILNFYSSFKLNKISIFIFIKIIFDIHVILKKNIIGNFMSNNKQSLSY